MMLIMYSVDDLVIATIMNVLQFGIFAAFTTVCCCDSCSIQHGLFVACFIQLEYQ